MGHTDKEIRRFIEQNKFKTKIKLQNIHFLVNNVVCGHRFYQKNWPQKWFKYGRFVNEIKVRESVIEEETK